MKKVIFAFIMCAMAYQPTFASEQGDQVISIVKARLESLSTVEQIEAIRGNTIDDAMRLTTDLDVSEQRNVVGQVINLIDTSITAKAEGVQIELVKTEKSEAEKYFEQRRNKDDCAVRTLFGKCKMR